jgi:hypothetical protein
VVQYILLQLLPPATVAVQSTLLFGSQKCGLR